MAKKKKRKGINSRDKGGRGERAVIKLLEKWWGSDFAKTPQSGGFANKKFRDDWNAASDVVTPDETFPFSIEVKWWEDWSLDQILTAPKAPLWSWWEQAKRETPEGKLTLLVFKKNRQQFFMMAKLESDYNRYQRQFIKSSRIKTTDNQGKVVYIRAFKDLLEEPKDKWAKRLRRS